MSKDNPTKQEVEAMILLVKNGWLKFEVTTPKADDPVSDLVTKNSSQDNTYTYPPSDPKRKANT